MIVVLLFVFFFKQKTAYEMRIRDWSSDVCSSDLVDQQLHAQKFAARLRHLARAFDEEIIVHPQSRAARVAATMRLVLRDLVRMVEIGRASCRERVCQYV